jgi:hypothetical protein
MSVFSSVTARTPPLTLLEPLQREGVLGTGVGGWSRGTLNSALISSHGSEYQLGFGNAWPAIRTLTNAANH